MTLFLPFPNFTVRFLLKPAFPGRSLEAFTCRGSGRGVTGDRHKRESAFARSRSPSRHGCCQDPSHARLDLPLETGNYPSHTLQRLATGEAFLSRLLHDVSAGYFVFLRGWCTR